MTDEDKTFSGSLVLDLRISWRHVHTLYIIMLNTELRRSCCEYHAIHQIER